MGCHAVSDLAIALSMVINLRMQATTIGDRQTMHNKAQKKKQPGTKKQIQPISYSSYTYSCG
jgi:hypothetical protein